MGQWRTKAREIIGAAVLEGKEQGVRGRGLRKFINARYEQYAPKDSDGRALRTKYPYRTWLEELDKVMYQELNGCSQMVLGLSSDDGLQLEPGESRAG